eukprot:NODE_1878_length_2346_cov_6.030644.p1 GENE.NODE_1878_length_2346_cov_6.030644~~NODE_1878_length_2346_cov_6.030644.p1  ORF type:complete len:675 (+),score=186.83 NODE_1878_length_2346_cov_6.030644:77-2026(+)
MPCAFVAAAARHNAMDIRAARIVAQSIFLRSMFSFTNRQALLLADSIFNRQGVVAGILQAILVKGINVTDTRTVPQLIEDGVPFADVREEVLFEHERQIAANGGHLNMFQEDYMRKVGAVNISSDMKIVDPFPGEQKVLWIRFVRSGDGERFNKPVRVDGKGRIVWTDVCPPEVPMEMSSSWPLTEVTRDEFISCTLSNPLMGEALRRLGCYRHQPSPTESSIALDVTIVDPHGQEKNRSLGDRASVQQALLFEVWDIDFGRADFLGEAWLPPLHTFTSQPKDIVMLLRNASFDNDGEQGPTRPRCNDQKKAGAEFVAKCREGRPDQNVVTPTLHCTVTWEFPCKVVTAEGEGLSERSVNQMNRHTGRLTILIDRIQDLPKISAYDKEGDPQVSVYLRNDVTGQWRRHAIMRTKIAASTCNPVYKCEKTIALMSGMYEARFKQLDNSWRLAARRALRRPKTKRLEKERDQVMAVTDAVKGNQDLRLHFRGGTSVGSAAIDPRPQGVLGDNHGVRVFLTDSVQAFRQRVVEACNREARHWEGKGDAQGSGAPYDDVVLGSNFLITTFVPPPRMQSLAMQQLQHGAEYKRISEQARADPTNWQPLDEMRTFAQYPEFHFDTCLHPVLVRIVEATEDYKSRRGAVTSRLQMR